MNRIAKIATMAALMALSIIANAQQQYSTYEEWTVGPGDYILDDGVPGCGQHSFDVIAEAAQAVAAARMGGVYGALGSVLQSAAQQARPELGGFVGQALDQIFGGGRFANCVPVSVVIPAGAQITGVVLQAGDGTGTRNCTVGLDCEVGWSRFDAPQVLAAGESKVVTSLFRNWSGDRTRTARMTVYFMM
jgi:hypothetical protein